MRIRMAGCILAAFILCFSCSRSLGTQSLGTQSFEKQEEAKPVIGLSNGFVMDDPPSGRFLIGYSVQERKIEVTRVGTGKEKALVLMGGIHGEEANTVELVKALRIQYTDNPERVPPEYSVFFIDVLNADGYAANTRENAHKVDLNKNFPSKDWAEDALDMKSVLVPGLGGSAPASEPEVYALKAFLLEYMKSAFGEIRFLSFHSACPPIGYIQPGYLKNGEAEPLSAQLAEKLAVIGGYKFLRAWKEEKPITGELICFCAENGILAMDVELPTYDMPDLIPKGKNETTYASCLRIVEKVFGL